MEKKTKIETIGLILFLLSCICPQIKCAPFRRVVSLSELASKPLTHTIKISTDNSIELFTPPIGNQGSLSSCAAWSLGYAQASIILYDTIQNWDDALRSPSFLYKLAQKDPLGNASIDNTLWKIYSEGICSYYTMPYTLDTTNMPTSQQKKEALQCRFEYDSLSSPRNVEEYKAVLRSGRPISVNMAVRDMYIRALYQKQGVWDSIGNITSGNHMTCVIGYDDRLQSFKVMDSSSDTVGDNGFYWVTYDVVRQGCYQNTYVLDPVELDIRPRIYGEDNFCDTTKYYINPIMGYSVVNWSMHGTIPSTLYSITSMGDSAYFYRTTLEVAPVIPPSTAQPNSIPPMPPGPFLSNSRAVQAIVTNGVRTDTILKEITLPTTTEPTISYTATNSGPYNVRYSCTITNLNDVDSTNFQWKYNYIPLRGTAGAPTTISNRRSISFTVPKSARSVLIMTSNTAACPNHQETITLITPPKISAWSVGAGNIEVDPPTDENYTYRIIDIHNQERIRTSDNVGHTTIDTSSLPNGPYILQIISSSGQIETYTILIYK